MHTSMIGGYTLAVRAGWHAGAIAVGFGSFLAGAIALLWVYRARKVAERAQPSAPDNPARALLGEADRRLPSTRKRVIGHADASNT